MKKQTELIIPPERLHDREFLYSTAAGALNLSVEEINSVVSLRRSIDARRKQPVYRILSEVYVNEEPVPEEKIAYKSVKAGKTVIVVGCGPAGMFGALRLIELGIKPIIIERGKDVQTRRKDLRAIQQEHIVNPDSNYCFGEGGAGTYSDGKLYTRSTKRGDVKKILEIFVQHGATTDIMVDAHPHIGSNKLPAVVKAMRGTIQNCGGEIHFNSRVTDFIIKGDKIIGVIVNEKDEYTSDAVILATGHSALDIYYLLHKHNIKIEPKPFAIGVRIEHPQELINEIQYHSKDKNPYLPAASYNLACDVNGRGVYSFCMCPGGIIVPAATAPGEIVVNGMSLSKRDSPFANSGFVAAVNERDYSKNEKNYPFNGLELQKEIEQHTFELANKTQCAPAQRVTDFIGGKLSQSLPRSSYIPGLTSAALHNELPDFIVKGLKKALYIFDKKMKGYLSEDAIIVATESRTSSPIRILRDKKSFMHTEISGLFPAGEGAGYAGGIVSAAIDGENCANAAVQYLFR
jgi:uncharacterized FAD-dependent dehydrogenase